MELEYRTTTIVKKSIKVHKNKGSKRKTMDFPEEDYTLEPKQKKSRKEKPTFSFLSANLAMPFETAKKQVSSLMSDPQINRFFHKHSSSFKNVIALDYRKVGRAEVNEFNRAAAATLASQQFPAITDQQLPVITDQQFPAITDQQPPSIIQKGEKYDVPVLSDHSKSKKSDGSEPEIEKADVDQSKNNHDVSSQKDSTESAQKTQSYIVTKFDSTSLKMTLKKNLK